jgi:ferredoxin-NADP reductase
MSTDNKNPARQNASKATIPTRPLKLQLKLLEKTQHSGTDVMSFKFARTGSLNSSAGSQENQYLNYKAGQYCVVNLGTKEDPEGPVRSFTMASSPTEEDFILITTRIRDTPFKKKLAALDIGSAVDISAPLGKFVLHDENSKPAVFLSGGIGVTPFRGMIKYATDVKLPVNITMFDANRNQANILFKDEFDSWLKINPKLRIIYTVNELDTSTEWKGENGYINKAMVERYLDSRQLDSSIFYICGPPGMLTVMKKLLQDELRVPNERIKIEEFVGY